MSVGVCITSSCEKSFETNNNLITMPVASVSPRRFSTTSNNTNTSSALVGSYRSTVDRPYYSSSNSYTRATNSYLSRTSNLDKTSNEKRIFSRHSSISDDSGIASSRTSSYSRTSESRDLPSTRRDLSGLSITGRRISSLVVADTVDDMRQKYSPSNYTPNIRKPEPKLDYLSRSKSISNDIGRPPPASTIVEARNSVTRSNTKLMNNSQNLTNNTNCKITNGTTTNEHHHHPTSTINEEIDNDNNNVLSVSEIRKLFDTATVTTNPPKLTSVIPAFIESKLDTSTTNTTTTTTPPSTGGTGTTITITNSGKHAITQSTNGANKTNGLSIVTEKCQNLKLSGKSNVSTNNGNNVRWTFLSSNDDYDTQECDVETPVVNCVDLLLEQQQGAGPACKKDLKSNHTTNFASYIPIESNIYEPKPVGDTNLNTELATSLESVSTISSSSLYTPSPQDNNLGYLGEEGRAPGDTDIDMSDRRPPSRITPPPAAANTDRQSRIGNSGRASSPKRDLSTSPRLNHASTSISTSTSNGSPSISTLERAQRANTVERHREDGTPPKLTSYGNSSVKQLGLNGLRNIGNTCFMNSVIQCLSNTRFLLEYLRDPASYMNDTNTTTSSMKGALVKAFANVIQELWSGESDKIVNTTQFKSQIQRFAPRFMGFAQQDAQEFLRFFLEGLHEDVNRVTVKPASITTEIDDKLSDSQKAAEAWSRYLRMDDSAIVEIFVGQLKSTLKCSVCGYCSVTFDPFWDLSLPIGFSSITQCLENFTREETLDGHEKPTCSKCQTRRKCTKSFSIQKFPKILVLHLKRFSPNERFRGKLTTLVDFPLQNLDLSAFAANRGTSSVYNLYAVSNHSGTTYSGHYTAYCKHPYSGDWHEYNDSRVSTITPRNVVSSEAYVLFYELSGHYSHL